MENRKILYSKLDKFIRKYYLNQLIRGCILTLLSLLVLFIFILVFNTLYDINFNYNRNGVKRAHLELDVNLDKNIMKILKILKI